MQQAREVNLQQWVEAWPQDQDQWRVQNTVQVPVDVNGNTGLGSHTAAENNLLLRRVAATPPEYVFSHSMLHRGNNNNNTNSDLNSQQGTNAGTSGHTTLSQQIQDFVKRLLRGVDGVQVSSCCTTKYK